MCSIVVILKKLSHNCDFNYQNVTVSYFFLYLKVAYYLSKEEMGFHKTLEINNFTLFFFKLPIRDIILVLHGCISIN